MEALGQGLRNLAKAAFKGHLRLSERGKRAARSEWPATPWKGSTSPETDWIAFCQFELVSGKLLIADASDPPRNDVSPSEWCVTVLVNGKPYEVRHTPDLIVDLPPGDYVGAVRCMQWGKDRRVSRFRVVLKGRRGQGGEEVGGVNVETDRCGVCDNEVFSAACDNYAGDAALTAESHFTGEEEYGVFALDEQHQAVMAFASAGFGEGGYPVYELVSRSSRVGVEVVFIEENEPYPF